MNLQTLLKSLPAALVLFAWNGGAIAQEFAPPLRPLQPSASPQEQQGTFQVDPQAAAQSPVLPMLEPPQFPSQSNSNPPPQRISQPSPNANTTPPAAWSPDTLRDPGRSLEPERDQPIIDSSLQPATYQQMDRVPPAQQFTQPNLNPTVAGNLLLELQRTSQQLLDRYQPMELRDMLANCDSYQHKDMVRQYWTAWHACADYLFAADEVRWLSQLVQPRDESERLVLEAARATVADAMMEKEIAATRQLQLLNKYLNGPVSETLPWPTDLPMVGSYKTHYDLYAANGFSSSSLQMIDKWLPQQRELILNRAETVQRCRNAIQRATQSYNQTGNSSATMLQALYLSRESHSAFSRSVAQYNREIAEYALTVKPNESTDEKVVAMLLPASRGGSIVPGNSGLRQASLPQDNAYYSTQDNSGFGNNGNGTATRPPAIRMGEFNGGQPALQPSSQQPISGAPSPPSTFRR